ncbi:hypothetical protein ONZ45_g19639 [Pleurotus djamor]|nr:hypothetical protein ONZ45_g19639 [Pleurotus djamor]
MDSFGQDVQAVAVAERPTSLPSSNARTNLRTDSNYRLGQNRYHPYADAAEARMERMVGTLQSDFTSTNIWRRSQLRVFTETNRRAMRYHPYHKDVFHESLNPCQPLI